MSKDMYIAAANFSVPSISMRYSCRLKIVDVLVLVVQGSLASLVSSQYYFNVYTRHQNIILMYIHYMYMYTHMHIKVLVHGAPDATNHLCEFATSSLGLANGKLFVPRVGEYIDASTESHIYQVHVGPKVKPTQHTSYSLSFV